VVDIPDTSELGAAPTGPSDRDLGVAVHRLFQQRVPLSLSDAEIAARVSDEPVAGEAGEAREALGRAAARLYRRFRTRADVDTLLASGECHFEVPFSFAPEYRPDALVRGIIDCLV